MADDHAAEGGGDDELGAEGAAEIGDRAADARGAARILQQPRALEVAVAVQAGGEQEVPLEQGLGALEQPQDPVVRRRRVALIVPPP